MPGVIYKGNGSLEQFTPVNEIFNDNVRHSSLIIRGDQLYVFSTKVGDIPERILLATVNMKPPSFFWKASNFIELLKPEKEYEGANLPLQKSSRSAINIPINQLRDPYVYQEGENYYLLYAITGERGIALAKIKFID